METVILCGGKGTRAYPMTVDVPKPLLPIGGRPILEHVMEIYAGWGYRSFVLAAGYRANAVADHFSHDERWEVEVVDSGVSAGTASRVLQCKDLLTETFFVTYGDGLGDIDLKALLSFHRSHRGLVTMTSVPLPSPYGTIAFGEGDRVDEFLEKPQLTDHWINAGFFVFEPEVFNIWAGDDLERDVLPEIARKGGVYAFRHRGFWKSMDTYKDQQELNRLAEGKEPPWFRS